MQMKKIILLTAMVIAMMMFSAVAKAQTLELIPISVGNYMEEWVAENFNMPNAKLVNIFTTPYISIIKPTGGYFDYDFVTSGDDIGYATSWTATYYDYLEQDTISLTFFVVTGEQYVTPVIWNYVWLEFLANTIFSTIPIEVYEEDFGNFISKIDAIDSKMAEAYFGVYIFGAGVPESIEVKGEKIDFKDDEAIFYSQFLLTDSVGNIDMCYQYFDSSDISCNYSSIRNEETITHLKLSPNPTDASTTLSFDLDIAGVLTITLTDLLGAELLELHNAFADAGTFIKTFSIEALPIGVYYIKVKHNSNVKIEKILKE